MKILELKSSNIKRLKAVELQLDEKQNLVIISGKNGAGKSSILDSIWYALGGGKVVPGKPIREGEDKAEVELDLGDYVVTRSFTAKGTYLKVENKEGAKYSNPQQLLDKLIGSLSFDPLEFTRLEAKKQISSLIQITGLNFSDLEERTKKITDDRTFLSREIKALGVVAPELSKAAEEIAIRPEVSIADLNARLEKGLKERSNYERAVSEFNSNTDRIGRLSAEIESLHERNKELQAVPVSTIDITELKTKIETAEKDNGAIREARNMMKEENTRVDKVNQYDNLSAQLVDIGEEMSTRLKGAKMPIDGLAWTEEAVTYHGIPFDQLSAAEQLKISMAMAMVADPKLRVILIRDGSLLDSENMKVIQEMAGEMDFQVWVEAVDESGKVGVYIEDGEVKENNYDQRNQI